MDSANKAPAGDWRARCKAELSRDKKKTATLTILLVVAGAVGGRLIVAKGLPQSAQAVAPAGMSALIPPADGLAPAPSPDAAHMRWEQYVAKMDRAITRDLFRPNADFFPPQEPQAATVVGRETEAGWFAQVGQWVAQSQAGNEDDTLRLSALRAQASILSLQSTMLGNSPTALINGKVLRVGDWISDFRLKKITSTSVIVSKDGVDIELQMK